MVPSSPHYAVFFVDSDIPERLDQMAPLAAAVAVLTIALNLAFLKYGHRIGPAMASWLARHRRHR